jgi:hypothetical protein
MDRFLHLNHKKMIINARITGHRKRNGHLPKLLREKCSMNCKLSLFGSLIFLSMLFAGASAMAKGSSQGNIDSNGLLIDPGGHLMKMNQNEALKACADHEMHLPTIKEWMKECSPSGPMHSIATFVTAKNADGTKDEFSAVCPYKPLAGEMGKNWFWSSSAMTDGSNEIYVFNGDTLYVGSGPSNFIDDHGKRGAVRCRPGRAPKKDTKA